MLQDENWPKSVKKAYFLQDNINQNIFGKL